MRNPGERLLRIAEASTAEVIFASVFPLVAATLLLFSPPPGGGPLLVSDRSERHFFTKLFARLAKNLSLDLRLSSFMCLPSLVA